MQSQIDLQDDQRSRSNSKKSHESRIIKIVNMRDKSVNRTRDNNRQRRSLQLGELF